MRKIIIIAAILFICLNSSAQISFKKGYFINNEGETVECLIKNKDWQNNPSEFDYKLTENSKVKTVTIKDVIEFKVADNKYERHEVLTDTSGTTLENLSYKKEPEFKEMQVFLKVLIEGQAILYSYRKNSLQCFFYSIDTIKTKQLIYKKYLFKYTIKKPNSSIVNPKPEVIRENDKYRFQLLSNLLCDKVSRQDIYSTNYKEKDLVKIFIKYNHSKTADYYVYTQKNDAYHITLKPSVSFSGLYISNSETLNDLNVDFDKGLNFGFGVEFELVLPFNNNKWSVYFDPNYQYFKSEKNIEYINTGVIIKNTDVIVDYKSIAMPFGLRYGMFLNPKNKIYINGGLNLNYNLGSYIEYKEITGYYLECKGLLGSYFGGIGYKYNNKFSIELKYQHTDLLPNYNFWNASYSPISLGFGYAFF